MESRQLAFASSADLRYFFQQTRVYTSWLDTYQTGLLVSIAKFPGTLEFELRGTAADQALLSR